jgi:large subunit ribosomal protein L14
MIQPESKVKVKDNSGALVVGCIRCLKHSKKNNATVGEYFISSVKKNIINKRKRPILKGQICKALLVTTVKPIKRRGNLYIKSNMNGVVLVNDQQLPIASRIFGPVFNDLRLKNLVKILSIADFVV